MIEIYRVNKNEVLLLPSTGVWNDRLQAKTSAQDREYAIGQLAQLFDSDWLASEQLISNTAEGRGTVYFFEAMQEKCVLRHYYRGGLVAKVSNDSFVYTSMNETRAHRELSILSTLFDAGLSVPKPLAARVVKKGFCYRADIITGEIERAKELHEILQQGSLDESAWKAIGKSIRNMHKAQAYHPDINVKNVLVQLPNSQDVDSNLAAAEPGEVKISLLDFDNCKIRQGESWKLANLGRFKRSLEKQLANNSHYHFKKEHWHWLEQGYDL